MNEKFCNVKLWVNEKNFLSSYGWTRISKSLVALHTDLQQVIFRFIFTKYSQMYKMHKEIIKLKTVFMTLKEHFKLHFLRLSRAYFSSEPVKIPSNYGWTRHSTMSNYGWTRIFFCQTMGERDILQCQTMGERELFSVKLWVNENSEEFNT